MREEPTIESLGRSVRRLTVAVWLLASLVGLQILISLVLSLVPMIRFPRATQSRPTGIPSEAQSDPYNDFHAWPLDRQIASASVIVATTWTKDGDRTKNVVSEILKQKPGTSFYYKVGDEYADMDYYPEHDVQGEIIFFTGSPAEMRLARSYRKDDRSAYSLDVLRDKIKASGN